VDEEAARTLARDVMGPCGLLGYFCGRGEWYPTDALRQRWKRAVGNVMGYAYVLLAPVWKLHPRLDPGRVRDALGLAQRTTSLVDRPEDMRGLLGDLDAAVQRAASMISTRVPGGAAHLRRWLPKVMSAISAARALLDEGGGSEVQP